MLLADADEIEEKKRENLNGDGENGRKKMKKRRTITGDDVRSDIRFLLFR